MIFFFFFENQCLILSKNTIMGSFNKPLMKISYMAHTCIAITFQTNLTNKYKNATSTFKLKPKKKSKIIKVHL